MGGGVMARKQRSECAMCTAPATQVIAVHRTEKGRRRLVASVYTCKPHSSHIADQVRDRGDKPTVKTLKLNQEGK